jgi:hypothetical protein
MSMEPSSRRPLSQLTATKLRVRAAEARDMAHPATSEEISAALYRLAERFERLANNRDGGN